MSHPRIIQGGMGAGISDWRLANAVATAGQLGVVSGTALDSILARRLQAGDLEGHMRRALAHFPVPEVAQRILDRYYIPGGKDNTIAFLPLPMYTATPDQHLLELTVAGNFAEVWLAKEGHTGVVGVNYLEKIQLPLLPCLYGAMLAGVDYVLVGAGIPREIPGVIDALTEHQEVTLKLHVEGAPSDAEFRTRFAPREVFAGELPRLRRPHFLAIIASVTLAQALAKKATGQVDGFVIEGPTAGGHNAPPRGQLQLNERGEPVYGPRDEVDLEKIKALGLPFWLAGGYADPQRLQQALEAGGAGVQVGTAFALCRESGLEESLKHTLLGQVQRGEIEIFTDPLASPTGFPFKVARLADTLSEDAAYAVRSRVCNLGYLRTTYLTPEGELGYRCAGEPVAAFVQKGGTAEEAEGRKCLCNGLLANIGLPQQRPSGYREQPLVTMGEGIEAVRHLIGGERNSYTAAEVIGFLLPQG
ncbi:MAG: nitronate monooxygenase [Candidatus Latescibacteria bacterium]|nr:nitronate monooxygenase [Candidatus Latescibacterota bacterium]